MKALPQEMEGSWGQSSGRFHVKWSDWCCDSLMQNDEISHFVSSYHLTKAFAHIWSWTGEPLRHPGRWDFKFSAKRNVFANQKTLFSQDSRESDNYVFWATYRPPLGWGDRQPVSVGLGHGVGLEADGITPVRELYLGLGTTIPDFLRTVAPAVAGHLQLLEAYYINIRLRATVR